MAVTAGPQHDRATTSTTARGGERSIRTVLEVDGVFDGFSSTDRPRLTWRSETGLPDWEQASATLEIERGTQLSSIRLDGADSVLIGWPVTPVRPRERVSVRVRVQDAAGNVGEWSEPVAFTGGVVADWPAPWVSGEGEHPVLLRGSAPIRPGVRRATLYVSAFGAARPSINGARIGDHELAPGWTSYQWRVGYDVYDVTGRVRPGDNVLGLELFGAWLTERYGFRDAANRFYSGDPSASAILTVDYEDGSTQTSVTGPDWRWTHSATTSASIYQGARHDSSAELPGWDEPGFDDSAWNPVRIAHPGVIPTPRTAPPVRVLAERSPIAAWEGADGETILDFGQNLVGRLRIDIDCPPGTEVVLRHAEVLEDGALALRPLRNAAATDVLIARGGAQRWHPSGTFHGFRYASVRGLPQAGLRAVSAEVLGTDLRRLGGFATAHRLLDRLHENVVWSARGNFLAIPTDCPQRDERLGWTGDVQVFAPAAAFLFDCRGFLSSWLQDLRLEQAAAGGVVPMVVPAVIPQVPGLFEPIAAWGDAVAVIPDVLHERYGDTFPLAENFAAIASWLEVVRAKAGESRLWEDGRQFGDWLDPDAPPDQPGRAKTDPDIVATAYFHRSAALAAKAARVLGRDEDAQALGILAAEVRDAFLDAYVTPRGRMMSDAPTAYALAIVFDLVQDDRRQLLGDRLAEVVRRAGFRISTGFAGTPIVNDALTSTGHADVAGRLLLQTENPSWLYPVTMGATTIWERWDSMLEDGSINPGQMTSFNHFALGAIADWMHRALGGLTPLAPGYRRTRFAPVFLDGVPDARVWHDSPYGRLEACWRRTVRDGIEVELTVPPGVRVEVRLPGVEMEVGNGRFHWLIADAAPAGHGPLPGTDAALTDVLESPEGYRIVMDELRAWDEPKADSLRRGIRWTPGRALRDPLDKVPVRVMDRIDRRLRALPPSPSPSSSGEPSDDVTRKRPRR